MFDPETGVPIMASLGHRDGGSDAAWPLCLHMTDMDGGTTVLAGGRDGVARLYDVRSNERVLTLAGHRGTCL